MELSFSSFVRSPFFGALPAPLPPNHTICLIRFVHGTIHPQLHTMQPSFSPVPKCDATKPFTLEGKIICILSLTSCGDRPPWRHIFTSIFQVYDDVHLRSLFFYGMCKCFVARILRPMGIIICILSLTSCGDCPPQRRNASLLDMTHKLKKSTTS